MRHLTLVAALIALVSSLSAPIAAADGRTHDRKTKDVVHGEAQDSADHGKSEKKQAERRGEKNKNKVRDTIRDESDDDSDSEDSDSDDSDHSEADDRAIGKGEKAAKGQENAASRGNAKSQEMRARRDERKAIKEGYKETDKDELIVVDGAAESPNEDTEAESTENKGKKPWWKFWD